MSHPSTWKKTTLRDLVTPQQLDEIKVILNEPPTLERTDKLREYLCQYREALELKGVIPEFLTYLIEYEQMKAMERFEAEERKNVQNN